MRTALTVAGSDSVGGAGIQADIKAMSSVGVHAASVITAVTAQNTCKVSDIFPMPADIVQAQLDAVLSDCDIKAVKTGMLYNAEIVGVVADTFCGSITSPTVCFSVNITNSFQHLIMLLFSSASDICIVAS